MAKILWGLAGTLVLVLAGLPVPAHSAPRAAAITTPDGLSCGRTGRGAFDYAGPGASRTYDDRFRRGNRLPQSFLDHWIPQGLGTWTDWGGPNKDLVLATGYNNTKSYSVLIGLVPGGGPTKVVKLPKPRRNDGSSLDVHVGGVAVVNGHLFIQGHKIDGRASIQRFSLAERRPLLETGGTLAPEATTVLPVGSASFLAMYGKTLFAGINETNKRGKMRRYLVGDDGSLTGYGDPLNVPPRVQGLVVTGSAYIFSTSMGRHRRSLVYVMRRVETDLDQAASRRRLACFPAPSMMEGLTRTNGRLYAIYESAAFPYAKTSLNPLKDLHLAQLSTVTSLIG